jgi:hypothetical protein
MSKNRYFSLTAIMALITFPLLAGDLEPSAPPGPTMKTLEEIPSSWSRHLHPDERFELVLFGGAVLDRETGLVWQRSTGSVSLDVSEAFLRCYNLNVGNRKGWRLPAIEELMSLVDKDSDDGGVNPTLPPRHPFSVFDAISDLACPRAFWSATKVNDIQLSADFCHGVPIHGGTSWGVWCVRGGSGPQFQ